MTDPSIPAPRRPQADPPVVPVVVQRAPGGGIRLASPRLPGWVASVRTAHDLLRAMQALLREADLAAYAAERGATYDAAPYVPEADVPRPPMLRAIRRRDGRRNWRVGHDPADWIPLPDGTWRSPGGLVFPPTAQVVAKVIALRTELGLATHHPDAPTTQEPQ